MMRQCVPLLALLAAIATFKPPAAIAHGVDLAVEPLQSLRVRAAYDSGEAMTNAAVVVYAPDNPAEPWTTGTTDDQGYFTFVPDAAIAGNWDIQVRQAGHGDIVSVPLSSNSVGGAASDVNNGSAAVPLASSTLQSPLQKGLMIGSVFWGCLGTALFFSTRTRQSN